MMGLIFVVDGEAPTGRLAQRCLEETGYVVQRFSPRDVIEQAEHQKPSLILIAAELANGGGFDLCRRIRQIPRLAKTPIVLLAAGSAEEDCIGGLDSGADDCVAKPFTPRELIARVQAVLRRFTPQQPIPISQSTDIVIDRAAMKLLVRGSEVTTTTLEFRLIDYMARHRGQVFTRDGLLDAVWGQMQFVTPRSVDACVRRVRNKIEPERGRPTYLKTLRGVGYRFDAVAAWPSDAERCDCPACLAAIAPTGTVHTGTARRRGSA